MKWKLTYSALSDDHKHYAEIFYERARKYVEIMEMKVRDMNRFWSSVLWVLMASRVAVRLSYAFNLYRLGRSLVTTRLQKLISLVHG